MTPYINIVQSIPVAAVFPGTDSSFETFRHLVSQLSRTDALFWCAKLNLIVSSPENDDEVSKQQYFLSRFFSSDEIDRVNKFCAESGKDKRSVKVLGRGQILELMRWICLFCSDQPNDGKTFNAPGVSTIFAKVMLIAAELWGYRVNGKLQEAADDTDKGKRWAMPALRLSLSDNSNSMDLWRMLARGKVLFETNMPVHRTSFCSEFMQQTGFSLNEYYLYMTVMKIDYCDISPEKLRSMLSDSKECGILNINSIMQQENLTEQTRQNLPRFLQQESQSPDQLANALWPNKDEEAIANARLRHDYTPLRSKPILRTNDGRVIILDPVFFAEKASPGPIFHVSSAARQDRKRSNSIFSDFGLAFQSYCSGILDSMYPMSMLVNRLACPLLNKDTGDEIIDACLNDVTEAVLFEMKGVFISDDVVENEDPQQYIQKLHSKYVSEEVRGEIKLRGAAQLARAINKIVNNEWLAKDQDFSKLAKVFPVLVVHDQLLTTPGHTEYLAEQFQIELCPDLVLPNGYMKKKEVTVTPLILIRIDDLEDLETSVNYFSLRDLLNDYSQDCPERSMPLRQYMAKSKKYQLRYNASMLWKVEQALRAGLRDIFGIDPDMAPNEQ